MRGLIAIIVAFFSYFAWAGPEDFTLSVHCATRVDSVTTDEDGQIIEESSYSSEQNTSLLKVNGSVSTGGILPFYYIKFGIAMFVTAKGKDGSLSVRVVPFRYNEDDYGFDHERIRKLNRVFEKDEVPSLYLSVGADGKVQGYRYSEQDQQTVVFNTFPQTLEYSFTAVRRTAFNVFDTELSQEERTNYRLICALDLPRRLN